METPPAFRVVERELQVFRRLWRGSLFTSFVGPVLYLAAMGVGLGGIIDRRGPVEGLSYLAFVTPGLLAATAMQQAAGESLWPVLGGMKWTRASHAMVATPLGATDVFAGFLGWVVVRTAMTSVAFLLVATVMGGVSAVTAPLAIPAAVLGGQAFAAPLGAFAATQDSDLGFSVIMRIGIVPLFLFSGTFFPISQLPSWLQPLCVLSPLWHSVELCRAATTGTFDATAIALHIVFLVACILAGGAWGFRTFTRRLTQ
jgi:lipooligosaccharide transport system permease protein